MPDDDSLENQIALWRDYLRRRQAIHAPDVEELESHLRDQITALVDAGLAADEAFLVAVKRMGNLDAVSREFAREHSERLWKQLVVAPDAADEPGLTVHSETIVVAGLVVAAALAVKAPELFGYHLAGGASDVEFYGRNLSLFVLPLLAGYFAWKRGLLSPGYLWLLLPFVAAAVFANVFPFAPNSHTLGLAVLHLPIALWLVVGIVYAGGDWRAGEGRMDFIRFSGEFFIYYVLIALGVGVFMMFTLFMFSAIDLNVGGLIEHWLLPCGAMGAVIVSAWLVEAKQSVIENIVPVLTRLFTPLFAVLLLAFLVAMVWTGSGIDVEREVLIGFDFDLLLVVVLGLLLYSISARDPQAPPNGFDKLQLLLVVCALIVDTVALAAIAARISEFGFTPNKVAALGENIILLVNLAWSAWLYTRFLRNRVSFSTLERWQTTYLPVYGVWAGFVVIVFPPLFGYA
jgi:hypothetical protein